MVARVAEIIAQPGKTAELCRIIQDQVPLVRELPGFVDYFMLVLESEARVVLMLSFWESGKDAEGFERGLLPDMRARLKPLIEVGPTVRAFDLRVSARYPLAKAVLAATA